MLQVLCSTIEMYTDRFTPVSIIKAMDFCAVHCLDCFFFKLGGRHHVLIHIVVCFLLFFLVLLILNAEFVLSRVPLASVLLMRFLFASLLFCVCVCVCPCVSVCLPSPLPTPCTHSSCAAAWGGGGCLPVPSLFTQLWRIAIYSATVILG